MEPGVTFKPYMLPVKFMATQSGFAVMGDRTLATPLGLISIGAKVGLPAKDDNSIRVAIRNRNRGGVGVGLDEIYDIKTDGGNFKAVTNGITEIQVTDKYEVIIDVTDGRIESIEFKKVSLAALGNDQNDSSQWSKHWQALPFGYHAWLLTQWAYDDSTMGKWYGVGFAVFLIRLIVATLLFFVDLLLVTTFFVAAIFYMFGEVARNIFYGFLAIFAVWVLWSFATENRRHRRSTTWRP